MSSMMAPPMPPSGGGVEASRSMLNPKDVALKAAQGGGTGETIGQWLQSMGVSFDDPKDVAWQKIKQQASNATTPGKIQALAGGPPPGGPPPGPPMGGAPPGPPQGPPQGLAGLMGR